VLAGFDNVFARSRGIGIMSSLEIPPSVLPVDRTSPTRGIARRSVVSAKVGSVRVRARGISTVTQHPAVG
jgi:hypothetical protein